MDQEPLLAEDIGYPSAPWHLAGDLHASVWLVPLADVPVSLPEGARPMTWRGRALVITAAAVYSPEGILSYNELMCMLAVRVNRRPAVTITHIWVDDPASAAGGRALWGIPKRLGTFRTEMNPAFSTELSEDGAMVASFGFVPRWSLPGWSLPGRPRILIRTAQSQNGRLKISTARAHGRLGFGRGVWQFGRAGPLAFMRGRTPIFSVRLDRMRVAFGL